jgi:holin-like protein
MEIHSLLERGHCWNAQGRKDQDKMLHAILILVAAQFVGDLIADFASLPIPGMVIGLVLLLAGLWLRGRLPGAERAVPEQLSRAAKCIHDHFGLLFVPAGAGVMANADHLAVDGSTLVATVLISTVLTIALTALVIATRHTEATEQTVAALQ